jgi:flagellar export protein FliJ
MAAFTFKLEPVRALREQEERRAQEDLARELALAAAHHAAVASAAGAVDEARRAFVAAGRGGELTPQELVARQAFLERREREQRRALLESELQAQQVELRRSSLEHAAREREVLERAKQRARDDHVRAELKVEEEALGEIALTLHRRSVA